MGMSMPAAQAAALAVGQPWLADVFYYGKEWRSPRQRMKDGKLQQAQFREHSVTDFQEEPWQAAAAMEEAQSSPTGVDADYADEDNGGDSEGRAPDIVDTLMSVLGQGGEPKVKNSNAPAFTASAVGQDPISDLLAILSGSRNVTGQTFLDIIAPPLTPTRRT